MQTRLLVAILTVLPFTPAGFAENLGATRRVPSIRANADLVLIPVTVTDRKGAPVTGLESRHFKLMHDNALQSVVSFTQQDVPCSVGVIVDTSGSMVHQLEAAKMVVRAFLETVAPRHEASLMSVSFQPKIEAGFKPDPVEVQHSLQMVRPGGSTALVDTLYLALNKMHSAHNPRRALLVISDGMDNHSGYSKGDLMRMAMEADVQIYTISIGVLPRYKKPMQVQEERSGLTLLEDLADKTGGLHYTVEFSNAAERAAKQVGLAIRNQYLIGYRPVDTEVSGKWHKIHVKLDVPNTNVYARNGYYAR
jgi:Ca-activated chloride channel family protein